MARTLTPCTVSECDGLVLARGVCPAHYDQIKKFGEVTKSKIRRFGVNSIRDEFGHKVCIHCHYWWPEENFPKSSTMRDGLFSYCKLCAAIRKHGINRAIWDEMLVAQSGLCKVCDSQLKSPCLDHDHQCCPRIYSCGGCIRGIICKNCNSALGLANESVQTLQKMITYLEKSCANSGS